MIHRLAPLAGADGPWPWTLAGEAAARDWLVGLGLRAGDRVALAGLNRPGTAAVLLAGLRLGLTLVLLNRRLTPAELAGQLERAACRSVLADPEHPLAGCAAHTALPPAWDGADGTGGPPTGALVLFTSGSSGPAKAVRLGANALLAATQTHVAALGLTAADTWTCPLPLDHIGGAMTVLRLAACGYRLHLHERVDIAAIAADIVGGATGASVVPTVLRRLLELRGSQRWPRHLRHLLTGGGPLDPALAEACAALGLPPSQTYGLSEMGSMVTLLSPADGRGRTGCAGRPVPGAKLRIVDGRIEVGGTMRCDGYEERGQLLPADAWIPTGDLGAIDADGFLRVHGRVAELIVSGGENIAAAEVEAALEAHSLVAEAAVCGLPDPLWGETVAAAIVPRAELTTDQLLRHLAPRLAGFKHPRIWRFVDALPRTGAGKLERPRLRGLFSGG